MTREQAQSLKQRYSRALLGRPEISAVGVTKNGRDGYVLTVYLMTEATPEVRANIEAAVEGNPVAFVVSGPFGLH